MSEKFGEFCTFKYMNRKNASYDVRWLRKVIVFRVDVDELGELCRNARVVTAFYLRIIRIVRNDKSPARPRFGGEV
jgi:hypothetical protein